MKRDRPVLRLITRGALSSAFTTPRDALLLAALDLDMECDAAAVDFVRGLRPWKQMVDGLRWDWRL